jgi:hypothetical protein
MVEVLFGLGVSFPTPKRERIAHMSFRERASLTEVSLEPTSGGCSHAAVEQT